MTNRNRIAAALAECPIVAILRGVKPDEVVAIGEALYEEGVRVIEVPLNSPEPFESIARLAKAFAGRAVIGAGTVLDETSVEKVHNAGGQIVVSPDTNPAVIGKSIALGLEPLPGVFTATEAFAAIRAGAVTLKLFPGDTGGQAHLKALKAVLPTHVSVLAVGGVDASNYGTWVAAGAAGAGCGSTLYRPGDQSEQVAAKARVLVTAAAECR